MKKNYFTGIIGALIGAIVCSLPWILIYIYGGWILSILAALVAFGAFKGYKILGGKVTKNTWIIIATCSIIAITVATFVIIPFWLIAKEGLGFSIFHFEYLYASGEFVAAILKDYIISLLFTILGISGVVSNIKKEGISVDETVVEKPIDLVSITFEDKVKYLENVYAKYNAFSKETAVSEFKIMKELNVTNKLSFMMEMEKKGIIVAPFVKSYFDKEALTNPEKAKKNWKKSLMLGIIIGILICVIAFVGTILILSLVEPDYSSNSNNANIEENIKEEVYTFKDMSITLPNSFKKMPDEGNEDTATYYNYGNDNIVQVFLQQYTIDEGDSKLQLDSYVNFLSESFDILEKTEITVNGRKGFWVFLNSSEYPEEYYYLYCTIDNKEFYSVMFYTPIDKKESSFDLKLASFKSNSTIKLNTLKIK